jgi:AcrR family transcriptional regulator
MTTLTREAVVDTAMRMVEDDGIGHLSMRKLAAELGVAVTSIYWHVGNRDALLDALVEREIADMRTIRPSGRTPEARLVSIARTLHKRLRARPHVITLVNERGLAPVLLLPAQNALARELDTAGVTGRQAAFAVRSILYHVIGYAVLERWTERSPTQQMSGEEQWGQSEPPGPVETFEFSTKTLVSALLS